MRPPAGERGARASSPITRSVRQSPATARVRVCDLGAGPVEGLDAIPRFEGVKGKGSLTRHVTTAYGRVTAQLVGKGWQRPTVRGVVMNPIDHPHGGGEGKTGEGRHPVDPWGNLTKGYRTRNNKRTQVMIVSRRKK